LKKDLKRMWDSSTLDFFIRELVQLCAAVFLRLFAGLPYGRVGLKIQPRLRGFSIEHVAPSAGRMHLLDD